MWRFKITQQHFMGKVLLTKFLHPKTCAKNFGRQKMSRKNCSGWWWVGCGGGGGLTPASVITSLFRNKKHKLLVKNLTKKKMSKTNSTKCLKHFSNFFLQFNNFTVTFSIHYQNNFIAKFVILFFKIFLLHSNTLWQLKIIKTHVRV